MSPPTTSPPTRASRSSLVLVLLIVAGLAAVALILVGSAMQGGGPSPTGTPSPSRAPSAASGTSPAASPGPSVVASETDRAASRVSPSSSAVVPSSAAVPSAAAGPSSSAVPSSAAGADAADPILAGMLQEADLPGMESPLGPEDGTSYDIDDTAFTANGGIRVTSRVWQSIADEGLSAVFDFRMQLPSDEAAAAYLHAAEPVLSEATANGQTPVPSPPVIGSDSRVYGLQTTGGEGSVLLRTYLFRVGPVAAKVLVGGPGVTAPEADAIARAAAARMERSGPPVTGSPRPPASPGPSPSAPPALPSGDLSGLLLAHVPATIAAGCVADAQRLWEGEIATLVCIDAVNDVRVTYSGFRDVTALRSAYAESLAGIDLTQVAASCDQGPFMGVYQVEGEDVGQVTCWPEQGGRAIMWSDERLAILSVAVSGPLDPAGLYLWWLEAGPDP